MVVMDTSGTGLTYCSASKASHGMSVTALQERIVGIGHGRWRKVDVKARGRRRVECGGEGSREQRTPLALAARTAGVSKTSHALQ